MRIPDPVLRLVTLDALPPARVVLVDFTTAFAGAVEISPYVSHYQYLRDLLSLYTTALDSWGDGGLVAASAAMATLTSPGGAEGAGGGDGPPLPVEGVAAQAPAAGGEVPAAAPAADAAAAATPADGALTTVAATTMAVVASPERPPRPSPASGAAAGAGGGVGGSGGGRGGGGGRAAWGGREAHFRRLVLEPRLQPLGELTPSLATVLGWLGVAGAPAVAAGLYDLLMEPLGKAMGGGGGG